MKPIIDAVAERIKSCDSIEIAGLILVSAASIRMVIFAIKQ